MRLLRVTALGALCAGLLVSGCARRTPPVASPEPMRPVVDAPPAPVPPPPPAPADAAPLSEDELFARKSLDELNAERPLGDAFFDLDQHDLRDDARAVLQKNAGWLRRWTSTRITVSGHCDERGTAEYNLALGERRANAVREYLVSLGVPGERILVISKGKESPFCAEPAEGCWQQNRRGHFLITAK